MAKDDLAYVEHMVDKGHQAMALARGKTREDYDRDLALRLALTHLIQIIGEAARRVSTSFRETHPHIPWDAEELPPLLSELKKLLPP
jgi:uncharacterized protein with HEPN domain